MQQQLDRVEQALSNLIDSITAFNPSVAAAEALVEADDGLTQCTQRLAEHQECVARVKALRATELELDEKIKANITLLDDTRTELLNNTPVTLPDSNPRQIDSQDLLNYAQRIARFTMPPTNRPALPPLPDDQPQESEAKDTKHEDSSSPPNAGDSAMPDAPNGVPAAKGTVSAFEALDDSLKNAVKPEQDSAAPVFVAWPDQKTVTSGALYRIQRILDEKGDPSTLNLANGDAPLQALGSQDQATGPAPRPAEPSQRSQPAARAARPPAKQANNNDFAADFDLFDPDG